MFSQLRFVISFFVNDTATTELYTLSLHDALPISWRRSPCATTASDSSPSTATGSSRCSSASTAARRTKAVELVSRSAGRRSEEHTSELQSHSDLVCRLLLEKKKTSKSHEINFILTYVQPAPLRYLFFC